MSLRTQFDAARALLLAAAAASKYSANSRVTTSASASTGVNPNSRWYRAERACGISGSVRATSSIHARSTSSGRRSGSGKYR